MVSAQDPAAPEAPAKPPIQHPQMGVCVHFSNGWYTNPGIPEMIAEAGFSWIREDFYWAKMEKEKGVYALPAEYEETIAKCHNAGLKILAIFNGGNKLYTPDKFDAEAYAKAAAWFAKETRGRVQTIEVLNEPHNFGYRTAYGGTWNGLEPDGSVSLWVGKYATLLNKAAPAIKAANPEAKVIGLGSVPPVNFRLLAMGIDKHVDGIVDHPYSMRVAAEYIPYAGSAGILKRDGIATADPQGSLASQYAMYRAQSQKFHGPKELWFTESGWPTYQEAKAGGLYAGVTEEAQAKYLLRRMSQALGMGVEMNFIYDFRDNGTDKYNAENNFGLVDTQLKPKISFGAVQRFNRYMADFRAKKSFEVSVFAVNSHPDRHPIDWDGSKIESSGKVLNYQFADSSGKPIIVIWSSERPSGELQPVVAEVEIATKEPIAKASSFDFYTGATNPLTLKQKEGRTVISKLSVPDYPLAIALE